MTSNHTVVPVDFAAVEADDILLDTQLDAPRDDLAQMLAAWRRALRAGETGRPSSIDADGWLAARDRRQRYTLAGGWLSGAAVVLAVVVLLLLLTGCGPDPRPTRPTTEPTPTAGSVTSVAEATPRYDPAHFGGSRWASAVDGPAGTDCTTRGLVLYAEAAATGSPVDADSDRCTDDGTFRDLYTGRTVDPVSDDEEVDHVLAQADAWRMGAWRWDRTRLWAFRNDQANLRATTGAVNGAKSDLGPDRWRPEDPSAWCAYAQVWQASARRWELFVTPARQDALDGMLATCGGRS